MRRILLHGLGQTASSWQETVRGMEERESVLCPELFGLLRGGGCTYANLYDAFSAYCAGFSEPVAIAGCPWAASLRCNTAWSILKGYSPWR